MAMVVDSQVEALYTYSYDAADGRKITFNAGEKFTLLSKANDDWWHVKRNGEKPMYVPANYVREIDEEERKQDDKLVLLTTRSNSTHSTSSVDNNGVCDNNSDSSVFKDEEDSESSESSTKDKPRLLSPGMRSLAKSLHNVSVVTQLLMSCSTQDCLKLAWFKAMYNIVGGKWTIVFIVCFVY